MPRAPRQVTVIPSVSANDDYESGVRARLRVAAYCRVSTEQEQQQSSYQTQISYYTQLITEKPEWILVGIYADGTDIIGLNQKTFITKGFTD